MKPFQRKAPYQYEVVNGERVQSTRTQREAGVPARATVDQRDRQEYYEEETVTSRNRGHTGSVAATQSVSGAVLSHGPLGCLYWCWCIVATGLLLLCAVALFWPRLGMDPWAFLAIMFLLLCIVIATVRLEG